MITQMPLSDIERFVTPETIFLCECAWCGSEEQYDTLEGARRDGWCVGKEDGLGLWCGNCESES